MQHLSERLELDVVLKAVKSCLPKSEKPLELHEPYFAGNEWKYVKECLDMGWVSSAGKFVDVLETKIAEFTGVRRAFAVVNDSCASYCARWPVCRLMTRCWCRI